MHNFLMALPVAEQVNVLADSFYFSMLPQFRAMGINVKQLEVQSMVDKVAINVVNNVAHFVEKVEESQAPQYYFGNEVSGAQAITKLFCGAEPVKSPFKSFVSREIPKVSIDSDNGMGVMVINGLVGTYDPTPVPITQRRGVLYTFERNV